MLVFGLDVGVVEFGATAAATGDNWGGETGSSTLRN